MHSRYKNFLKILFIFFVVPIHAQHMVNSPYSRFNIGTLSSAGSFRSLAMGKTGIAMRDNSSIYFFNPASYSSIDTTSFLFDFGGDVSVYSIYNESDKHVSTDANFNHLLMGFPISDRIGLATGIIPLSNGYYYISEYVGTTHPDYDPVTGEYISLHRGTGTFSSFFLGTGMEITKELSIGANIILTFGEINRLSQYEFADYANTFSQRNTEAVEIKGINLDYGIQYNKSFKKKHFLTAGFSMNVDKKYRSDRSMVVERFSIYSTYPFSPDTLSSYANSSGDSTRFPASFRFGLAFGKKDKFVAEADYIFTRWKEGLIHGDNSYLANTGSFRFGIEYIPEKYSNTSFLKRVEYRLGGHISDNYLAINGGRIKEYGVSCGLGIRMMNSLSKATLYFDYTNRQGDNSKGLHSENVYSIGLSLNLYDFWFLKRKYE